MPRPIKSSSELAVPDNVTVTIESRVVTVKGPRGSLTKSFQHLDVDLYLTEQEGAKKIMCDVWFGKKKLLAATRTVTSHINNMFLGVTTGFRYTMRFVYAHFPINANIPSDGKKVEIRNFLGEKRTRKIEMLQDTKISRSDTVKDQLVLTGNDIEAVSRSCALIHQTCLVKKKDIRMFLDGIYVESKGLISD